MFGGTFDPIHNTHIEIARAALTQARLDTVLFVVAAQPPHKRGEVIAAAEDRFAMAEAAAAAEPAFEASRIELDREGPSYTVDTLADLAGRWPNADFWLIIGQDSLVDFPQWRDPDAIRERARLLVAPRPGSDARIPAALAEHCQTLVFPASLLSSTEVRDRIARGASVGNIVPPRVLRIIEERGLYGVAARDTGRR